ncbi:hypothetical protein DFH11DRAFT_1876226 [Phellopilus nigrolimitatus]|nr:hypothetical protein DFH11DRAFT_1876226 [Phellopilus nigrolimitatus]
MTSRLKRKLNGLGVDTASSKASENFCLIGTPLPPLEKSKDTGEFVPLWKQEVTDEKGRRRLHGAFTGGFSAGYFNSVGSKEGWAPAAFTSSRADRAKKKAARPEDFMDEEDLAEIRDNQKLVNTTEEMDIDLWERGRNAEGPEKDSIVSALEASLLPAPRDSVGAKILKKMGWRLGHGIGPRVTYEQRKRQDTLSFAPTGSGGELRDAEEHEEAKKHLYPPRDTKVPSFKRKENSYGLGYNPGMGLTNMVAAETTGGHGQTAKQGSNISAGFGLGALNDADEDDLDVYDRGADHGSRLAYDENEDDERIIMGSRKKTAANNKRASLQSSRLSNQESGKRAHFNNGTPCLPGFVVTDPVTEDKWFPLPEVPKGWEPNPRRVWEQDKENFKAASGTEDAPAHAKGAGRQANMTANQRGNLLGETALPGAPRSVFDYLAPKDRDRLKHLAEGKIQPGAPASEEPGPTSAPDIEPTVPRLDPQVAKMALQGFQPFTTDPVKQARYTAFLQAQAAGAEADYVRSAQIFKPASGAMAGRFTRAAVLDTGSKVVEGLHRPVEEGSYLSTPGANAEKEKEAEKEESPKENAARLGMYGPLTREVKPWMPAKLLCKRFGVKEPIVEPSTTVSSTSASSAAGNWQSGGVLAVTDGTETALSGSTHIGTDGEEPGTSSSTGKRGKRDRDIANIGLGDDETQGRDILTYERPAMDIFKAIFASDDED